MTERRIIIDEAAVVLLVLLKSYKSMMAMDAIRERSGLSSQTVYNNVRKLQCLKLIREEIEEKFPRRRLISLTEKGKRVAELLNQIERILNS